MPETYSITLGGLFIQENQTALKYCSKWLWIHIKRILLYMIIFVICFGVTGYIFANCIAVNFSEQKIPQIALGDCIALGSIFATFGSAIISFLSLTSAHQISGFQEKVSVLNGEFSKLRKPNWKRWDFLPRFSRERLINGRYQYFILKNAKLTFYFEDQNIDIPIPSVEQDFKDLPVLYSWFRLHRRRKFYLAYVQRQSCMSDFFMWDCLMALYKNIIVYKLSQFGIWIGTSFIINSIIYAFFYAKAYLHISILF